MKNFFDCKDEKITEKAFSQSLMISVVSILLCLVMLCSMSYAWFTVETTSSSNTLTSGSFALGDISVKKSNGEEVLVNKVENEEGVWCCTLPTAGKEYTVTLTLDAESTAKGHCVISINGEDKNTAAIIGDNTANREGYPENSSPFTFTIQTTKNDTVVEFRPVWGVVATPDIQKNKTYSVDTWEEVSTQESKS